MRNSMRRSCGTAAFRSAMSFCIAMAHSTAATIEGNSTARRRRSSSRSCRHGSPRSDRWRCGAHANRTIAEFRLEDGRMFRPDRGAAMPSEFHDLVKFGILASAQQPFDPMERAFHEFGRQRLGETGPPRGSQWKLVRVYGLGPDLLAVTQVWQIAEPE